MNYYEIMCNVSGLIGTIWMFVWNLISPVPRIAVGVYLFLLALILLNLILKEAKE